MQKCTSTLQNYQQVISLWKKPMPPKFELFSILDFQYLLPQKIPTFPKPQKKINMLIGFVTSLPKTSERVNQGK